MNRCFTLCCILVFVSLSLTAQKTPAPVYLKSGAFTPASLSQSGIESFNQTAVKVQGQTFGMIQLESLPTDATRKRLADAGIELLQFVSSNTYTFSARRSLTIDVLRQVGVVALMQPAPQQKMDAFLSKGQLPSWAVKATGTVDVLIALPKTFALADVLAFLQERNFTILPTDIARYGILKLRVSPNRLQELASFPFVSFLQAAPPEDVPLNSGSRGDAKANLLNASIADGGKGLNGEGVVLGIGDNADVQYHVDFTGRLINRSATANSFHGVHTTGTMAGAGIRNELHRGYTSRSTIISQYFSGILTEAPTYVQDYGMVLTNNSYGNVIECAYNGTYDLYASLLDQQAFDYPSLEHVFAAGNSGGSTCAPYMLGFHTVLGGYQSAKNVISVGATTDAGVVASFSSRGPVLDGRIKPDLTAKGQGVVSTSSSGDYGSNSGTSMAAPGVTGGLGLLYQRYRQLHSGNNPQSALMKALLCNGATDRGTTGPDFLYGFGGMNLLRSVTALDSAWYFLSSLASGATNTHSIAVPAGTAQLKVMLYWHDPAASPLSVKTLVNDLDLEVVNLSSNVLLPYKLDTTAANLSVAASTGADHINNMEQVVIAAPPAGNYIVRVKGTAVAQGPQAYVVAYDPIPTSLQLTYPAGGTALVPGEAVRLQWESYGDVASTFALDYSIDDGTNWLSIATGVPAGTTSYAWTVPAVVAENAKIRVRKEATGAIGVSGSFTIIAQPVITLAAAAEQCEGYIKVSWTAVPGATKYLVTMLRGSDMQVVDSTTALTYIFSGLTADSTYWVSVNPRINNISGRRAAAVSRQPNTGSCNGAISDNDLKLSAIVAPFSGRQNTVTALSAASVVKIVIKNLDNVAVTGFTAKYSLNGGAYVSEVSGVTINAGATYTYTFTTPADFSAAGDYTLQAIVKNATADLMTSNDTATALVRHLANPALSLNTSLVDGFEGAVPVTYNRDTLGLLGADRFDFSRSTSFGRLRPFVNSGFAYAGTKALTLDMDRYSAGGNISYLHGTYNLSAYNAATSDLRLDFYYNDHGQVDNAANKVWIRGSDASPWIEAYDLNTHGAAGTYERTSSIELSRLLTTNGQNFSSSFGVRWGQYGQFSTTVLAGGAGYSFDEIRLSQVMNDLQVLSISEPISNACALSATTPVKVNVRNGSFSTLTVIPVRYRINGGGWLSDTIASLASGASFLHTFSAGADLSAYGNYLLEVIVDYATDNLRQNDTLLTTIVNTPLVASFPHLQDFESSNGYWYSGGKNSTWAYGTPASQRISEAASGTKAWKTRLVGNYSDDELSYLYSPCYNISALTVPTLSFSIALDLEDCGSSVCDAAWVEYSTNGTTWTKLRDDSVNWYNNTAAQVWSTQSYTRWHVATSALPIGATSLRLRFVLSADPSVNREGIAIDNIHIYDNIKGIAPSVTMAAPVTQTVSGSGWTDFESGGALVASIRPASGSLGATALRVYVDTSASRWVNGQYYGARNLTIKPVNRTPADSVSVRFYFTDREVELLIGATGCAGCAKPSSVYDIGVSKYTDVDTSFENGSVSDNVQGAWSFIPAENLTLVPFDKGYYVEFKVASFSEFWLNNGGLNGGTPLPATFKDFIVRKDGRTALVQWTTASEADVDRFEIEMARASGTGTTGFTKIGEVSSRGNSVTDQRYSFGDTALSKSGLYYYRLRTVDRDGSVAYSPVRSLYFSPASIWTVHPNPSTGLFNLTYQLERTEVLEARIFDGSGKLVRRIDAQGIGAPSKLSIDLSNGTYPAGMYLLQVTAGSSTQSFRLYKR